MFYPKRETFCYRQDLGPPRKAQLGRSPGPFRNVSIFDRRARAPGIYPARSQKLRRISRVSLIDDDRPLLCRRRIRNK